MSESAGDDNNNPPSSSNNKPSRPSNAAGGNEVSVSDYGYSCLWCLLLTIIAWPLAIIAAIVWVLMQPFETCMPCAKESTRFLYPWLRYPRRVGRAIHNCDKEVPKPVPMPDNVQTTGGGGDIEEG